MPSARDVDLGVYITLRLDGSLSDLRHLTAKRKKNERIILEALFADDCTLMTHQDNPLQAIVDKFYDASEMFGLTISLGNTKVHFSPRQKVSLSRHTSPLMAHRSSTSTRSSTLAAPSPTMTHWAKRS